MSSPTSSKIVLITGANTGLGFETAKALFASPEPYHILIGCRGDISRANDAISKLKQLSPNSKSTAEPLSIDIADDSSIAAAFEEVKEKFGYIDVLVNNAGADFGQGIRSGRLSVRDGWNAAWDVNVTGTHIMTETFAPLLLASKSPLPRLLFITSGISSLHEYSSGTSPGYPGSPAAGWPKPPQPTTLAYRSSKAGMNMMVVEWARVLQNDGVKVFNISPGFLDTGLGNSDEHGERFDKIGAIDPAIGGGFVADVVAGKRDEHAWPTKVLRKDMVQPY